MRSGRGKSVGTPKLTAERFRPHAAGYKEKPPGDLTAYDLLLTAVPVIRKTLTILSLLGLPLSVALVFDQPIIELVAVVLAASGAIWIIGALRRRHREWKNTRDEIRDAKASGKLCAACGYNMEGQPIPRCPECGALRGFTASVDQLGLTEEEIRKGFERKREARTNLGLCVKCGYDLHGAKERCPECGETK